MVLDFIPGAFLNIQHQVSSIQHRPRKGNGLAPTSLKLGIQIYATLRLILPGIIIKYRLADRLLLEEYIKRLFFTLQYLRSIQVVFQLLRKLPRQRRRLAQVPSTKLQSDLSILVPWMVQNTGDKDIFRFLNTGRHFPGSSVNWRCPEMSKLWRYNLHYFDYLLDAGRPFEDRCRLIDDWIAENPVGVSDGWESFPVSLRIVNWIKFFLGEGQNQIKSAWLTSLYQQTLWLKRNVEYHLLGNHLFKNAKALIFAGAFFDGADAKRWLVKGLKVLTAELKEQVLLDGGHFERSPMYHTMILKDCLDLINLLKPRKDSRLQTVTEKLKDTAGSMVAFLSGLCHPDEQIALFNDAAFGIEFPPKDVFDYYENITGKKPSKPKGPLLIYPNTGYYVMSPDPGNRMLIDCGPIGPEYQPGHSHCDTLSFELSVKGKRVIVDSGCFQYEDGSIRQYNRGNAGHNTITIDGENQSEVWAAHRCARRARPIYAKMAERQNGLLHFEGAHDGYKRLKGHPIHHRSITWSGDSIVFEDRIEGRGIHGIESRLHIHPRFTAVQIQDQIQMSEGGEKLMTVSAAGPGNLSIENGWYCPEFNKKFSCPVVSLKSSNMSLPFKSGWKIQIN